MAYELADKDIFPNLSLEKAIGYHLQQWGSCMGSDWTASSWRLDIPRWRLKI